MKFQQYRSSLFGLLAGVFLSAGLIGSAMLVTNAWLRVSESQVINVTGSARKNIRSDLVIWHGNFFVEADTLLASQQRLKGDLAKVEAFLNANQFTNYQVSPIAIQSLKESGKGYGEGSNQKTVGYRLTQTVTVESVEVDRVIQLDRASAAVVEQGVAFTPAPLDFIYSKAGEIKAEMLAEATKDARTRAEQIAEQGGRTIKQLRSARMGIFQITPRYSTQTSWEGMNDTTSLDKTVTAVVNAVFSLK